jgi:hypothetical protein
MELSIINFINFIKYYYFNIGLVLILIFLALIPVYAKTHFSNNIMQEAEYEYDDKSKRYFTALWVIGCLSIFTGLCAFILVDHIAGLYVDSFDTTIYSFVIGCGLITGTYFGLFLGVWKEQFKKGTNEPGTNEPGTNEPNNIIANVLLILYSLLLVAAIVYFYKYFKSDSYQG